MRRLNKDLAITICLEADELMEIIQWSGADIGMDEKAEKVEKDLAGIVNYCILMADVILILTGLFRKNEN